MIGRQGDEETPLLQRSQLVAASKTPLPWDQLWVVLFLQAPDPFAAQTLAPFTPQVCTSFCLYLESGSHHNRNLVKLIRDIGVTHGDESLVGHYVGILVR
jgi:hypothetical protein